MNLVAALGHVRGEYMAERRRQAFRQKFGRDPVFKSFVSPNEPDDFVTATKILNIAECYRDFENECAEKVKEI